MYVNEETVGSTKGNYTIISYKGGIFHLILKLTELLITTWAEITARYDVRSNENGNWV